MRTPYAAQLASQGIAKLIQDNPAIRSGVNTINGKVPFKRWRMILVIIMFQLKKHGLKRLMYNDKKYPSDLFRRVFFIRVSVD